MDYINNINNVARNHNVDPMIFIILYFGTFAPCWYGVWKIGSAIRKKNLGKLFQWLLIEGFLLIIPYLYVALLGKNLPIWFWIVLVLLISASFVKTGMIIRDKDEQGIFFWDIYSFFYDSINFSIPYRKLMKSLIEEAKVKSGNNLLDIGCGTGNLEKHCIKNGLNITIEGVDSSEHMLYRARKKLKETKNIHFRKVDLSERLPFEDNSFDCVIGNNVIYAVEDKKKLVTELHRVLKSGGKIIISDPRPNSSIRRLIVSHLKEILRMKFSRGLLELLKFVFVMPIAGLPVIILDRFFIEKLSEKGLYLFSTKSDLTRLFSNFNNVKIQPIYENQNWLVAGDK